MTYAVTTEECPSCKGVGHLPDDNCHWCFGLGVVEVFHVEPRGC